MPPEFEGGICVYMGKFEEPQPNNAIGTVVPLIESMPADLLTPLAVYLKLSSGYSASFLLESVSGGENLARYSFIGADPHSIATSDGDFTSVTRGTEVQTHDLTLIDFLREHFRQYHLNADADLPAFSGGAIGYLGFSAVRWFEPVLRGVRSSEDDGAFMFYRSIVAFDHAKQLVHIISLVFAGEAKNDAELEALLENARAANISIRKRLESGAVDLPTASSNSESSVASNFERSSFEAAVDEVKELIRAGECYQVVLSQRFSRRTAASPVGIYRALRSLNPSPYMFLLQFADKAIIGASPEMLVRCRDRKLDYRPIAGTRRRGVDATEDKMLSDEMLADQKEVAEHLMLVDLGRNDLGRVSEFGSVKVDSLMQVEKYSHVQHLVSSVSGTLREGLDAFDALAASFPAGTVSGAPKVRAIEIIEQLEPTPRGVYSGAVGYFDYAGNIDTCIAIRTLVLEHGVATVQAGAGIVADSIPENEFEETVNKAKALLRTIEVAEGGSL